jgi:LacI family transcriptional regulator
MREPGQATLFGPRFRLPSPPSAAPLSPICPIRPPIVSGWCCRPDKNSCVVSRAAFTGFCVSIGGRIHGVGQNPLLYWDDLANWQGDGLIAVVNKPEHIDMLVAKEVPVVISGSRIVDSRLSNVACDSTAIGRMAAEHLMECGLKNFLFMSELRWVNEQLRFAAFESEVKRRGHNCNALRLEETESVSSDASAHYSSNLNQIAEALRAAPKPLGVCTPNSVLARMVVELAIECGFEIPDDIAVLGVTDDPLICESTVPHLSAVIQPTEQIGYQSAIRLDALMSGEQPESRELLLKPLGIASRQSTDMLAVEDDDVREALKFIRTHACEAIEVSDVVAHVAVSRRTLETKFRAHIGRTPALELRRVRLELAKKLLAETNDPITSVVFASGFNSRQVFSSLFHRATGVTPSEYRRTFRIDVLGTP